MTNSYHLDSQLIVANLKPVLMVSLKPKININFYSNLIKFLFSVHSEKLHTKKFWGTRQQLLSGKVIVDWLETEISIDPIFGVLLCPCGGKIIITAYFNRRRKSI